MRGRRAECVFQFDTYRGSRKLKIRWVNEVDQATGQPLQSSAPQEPLTGDSLRAFGDRLRASMGGAGVNPSAPQPPGIPDDDVPF